MLIDSFFGFMFFEAVHYQYFDLLLKLVLKILKTISVPSS